LSKDSTRRKILAVLWDERLGVLGRLLKCPVSATRLFRVLLEGLGGRDQFSELRSRLGLGLKRTGGIEDAPSF